MKLFTPRSPRSCSSGGCCRRTDCSRYWRSTFWAAVGGGSQVVAALGAETLAFGKATTAISAIPKEWKNSGDRTDEPVRYEELFIAFSRWVEDLQGQTELMPTENARAVVGKRLESSHTSPAAEVLRLIYHLNACIGGLDRDTWPPTVTVIAPRRHHPYAEYPQQHRRHAQQQRYCREDGEEAAFHALDCNRQSSPRALSGRASGHGVT